ncbi:hypothetical protein LXL04_024509 [Taraxacum kok-saghyz]
MAAAYACVLASIPIIRITKMPQAVLNKEYKMKVRYKLKQGQSRIFHELPSGLNMEVIYQKGVQDEKQEKLPPLVFVHGSFHAAWCWAEYWQPFFSQIGFDSYALSLLGQGESDAPDGSVAGTLQVHESPDFCDKFSNPSVAKSTYNAIDTRRRYRRLHPQTNQIITGVDRTLIWRAHRPVLHRQCVLWSSFFHKFHSIYVKIGMLVSLTSKIKIDTELAGAVLVCSVPPTGNSGLVWRYLFSKPLAAFKVTMSLAAKAFQTSLPLCKETFFSKTMDDHLVLRYQELMTESSRMPLFDLRKLNASLPVASIAKSPSTQVLVMGASDDFIVDAKGLEETGSFYGVKAVCVEGVAHDMMLDSSWEKGAQLIFSWIKTLPSESS